MTPLPIDSFLPEITDSLRKHRAIVLVAEPGAGKTTRVPPAILNAGLLGEAHPNLMMLQPRRIAARASAERIGEEQGWAVGERVGYQVRFENRITARTRLRVVTEAILTRQLLDDPSLEGIGCVVLDEFHERSIHSDIALALLNEVKQALRDDLLLVVMSATLDAGPVAKFLGDCPIIRVPGRTFPVEISYKSLGGAYLDEAVARVVREQWKNAENSAVNGPGDTLVFLPGAAEIDRCQQALSSFAAEQGAVVRPLHGSLPFDQQRLAVAPSSVPKIVLATNIAETSLTIDGVCLVIDSGLARQASFDPQRGLDALNLGRISQASAAQRAGRAGRTAAGKCIRLWTAAEQQQMNAFDAAEIARVDLAPTLLDLHAWGQADPNAFGWYEAPPAEALAAAEQLLKRLGALDDAGKLTALGKRMQVMPVHPRLARLLIAAADLGQPQLGATVAALLSEKDFVRREWQDRNAIGSAAMMAASDVEVRLHLLEAAERARFRRGAAGENVDALQAQQVARVRDQLLRNAPRGQSSAGTKVGAKDPETILQQLVLLAYPDRVCRRRAGDPKAAVMVGGVGIRLDNESAVHEGEYFIAVDPRQDDRTRNREAVVRIASRIEPAWLDTLFPQSIHKRRMPVYDEDRGRVIAVSETRYLDLALRQETETNVPKAEAGKLLAEALAGELPAMIEGDERLSGLIHRIRFAARHAPDHDWPAIAATPDIALLEEAAQNKQSREQVRAGLFEAIRNRLIYPMDRLLDQLAPESLTVPTGSQIKLTYNADPAQPPVLAVRLQEVFGLIETPRVAGGRVGVLLHLLGPNYRPVQITQDLASFWKNTYLQVRKDLRADYPRHSWPDDPLTAPPVRGAKRRGT
ncbi:MAG: ATP-dependent helicase HrpB [Phycisphaerales bacterium]|nr:ATP-dependent helicase HrpB [Phycisphaerales bacterium]